MSSSLAAGIGARGALGSGAALAFFAKASVLVLLLWAGFALLTFEIGSRILPTPDTRTDVGELLRTLGFAATPAAVCETAPRPPHIRRSLRTVERPSSV